MFWPSLNKISQKICFFAALSWVAEPFSKWGAQARVKKL